MGINLKIFTYTAFKGVMYNYTASIGDTNELLPYDLQALGRTRLTPQEVHEFPIGWFPQSEETVSSTGDQVAPRCGLDLMQTLIPSLLY